MRLVARNYRCRGGEIDLLMRDGDCLVVIEVRYRHRGTYGRASATVDRRKQQKLIRTAAIFLSKHTQFADTALRFDVIGIDDEDGQPCMEWLKDAFRP